jgi:hypothetical protein
MPIVDGSMRAGHRMPVFRRSCGYPAMLKPHTGIEFEHWPAMISQNKLDTRYWNADIAV